MNKTETAIHDKIKNYVTELKQDLEKELKRLALEEIDNATATTISSSAQSRTSCFSSDVATVAKAFDNIKSAETHIASYHRRQNAKSR